MSQTPHSRSHLILTIAMCLVAILCTILTILSLANSTLYTPLGASEIVDSTPSYYFGISIYITIGATLFTSALIRIALRISR